MVIPKIDNNYKKERAKDELPQSGSGKSIHTTEPKFVPNEAVEISMDLMVIPKIDNNYKKERAKDELPQSGSGKSIHTTEPKFVPNEAVEISLDDELVFKVRMVDCVGYIVKGALGYLDGEEAKMVHTPWYEYEIPFEDAAEIGTRKVITDHSTIGIVVTTDGSITGITREEYVEAEERVISELQSIKW